MAPFWNLLVVKCSLENKSNWKVVNKTPPTALGLMKFSYQGVLTFRLSMLPATQRKQHEAMFKYLKIFQEWVKPITAEFIATWMLVFWACMLQVKKAIPLWQGLVYLLLRTMKMIISRPSIEIFQVTVLLTFGLSVVLFE